MGAPKGVAIPFSAVTQTVQGVIDLFSGEGKSEVSVEDIWRRTSLKRRKIAEVLSIKTREGCFARVGFGRYRIVEGMRLEKHRPLSFIADKCWTVFHANRHRFMRGPEVLAEVETLAGERSGLSMKSPVYSVLTYWHRSGYLERIGKRGNYAYQLLPGIIFRPPIEK